MVVRIYPPELQLKLMHRIPKPVYGFTFINLNGFVSSKLYDKRDDFGFDIVNFPVLDGDVPVLHYCSTC